MTGDQIKWTGFAIFMLIASLGFFMGPIGYIIWMPPWIIGGFVTVAACNYLDKQAMPEPPQKPKLIVPEPPHHISDIELNW